MRQRRKLLIATTNEGKYREIMHFLNDLPFEFISLKDVGKKIPAPDETENNLEGNALLKAKYYAKQTGLLALADDSGLFIDALDGWPGVLSDRVEKTKEGRTDLILKKLLGMKGDKRQAMFNVVMAVYDPKTEIAFFARANLAGLILKKPVKNGDISWGYNNIFYVPNIGKTYGEMTVTEKNSISHRGQALGAMKYILMNQYGAKHIVVPLGIVIKDGKVLLSLRNDPHRPEMHKKWEFPGGSMDIGETIESNLIREVKEETGFDVEIVRRLDHIALSEQNEPKYTYQVYLLPHICQIIGGSEMINDAEVMELRWVDIDEVLAYDLIGANAEMYRAVLGEITGVVKEYSL